MLITAGLNLFLSVILGNFWGVPGILFATGISKLLSQYWYEPRLLFSLKFKKSVKRFYFLQLKQTIACLIAVMFSYIVCSFIGTGLAGIIIRVVVSGTIAIGCVLCFNFKSAAWKELCARYIIPCLQKIKK